MGHKNYTNYSKSSDNNTINQSDLEHIVLNGAGEIMKIDQNDVVIEEDDKNVNDGNLENNEKVEDDVILPGNAKLMGVVIPAKLNVRKQPSKDSEVLEIITKNSEVEINFDGETDTFYKIYTKSGVEGYCMKEFINIK